MLVVDDQEDVREVTAAQLDVLGYRVVQAASGRTALDLLGNCDAIDLLIVDYAMPEMSGIDVARAARDKCPDLPVIIATGYVDTTRFDDHISNARIMKKPYRMADLADTVDYMLHHKRHRSAMNVAALRTSPSRG